MDLYSLRFNGLKDLESERASKNEKLTVIKISPSSSFKDVIDVTAMGSLCLPAMIGLLDRFLKFCKEKGVPIKIVFPLR